MRAELGAEGRGRELAGSGEAAKVISQGEQGGRLKLLMSCEEK